MENNDFDATFRLILASSDGRNFEDAILKPDMLTVFAQPLQEAARIVVPEGRGRRSRSIALTLRYDPKLGALILSETKHGLASQLVPAQGGWPSQVQVNGLPLRRVCETYPSTATIQLIALRDSLVLVYANSSVEFPRLDASGKSGVIETTIPTDKRHKGRVPVPPEAPPTGRFPWNDTWDFSARVPFPQHRNPPKRESH